MTSPACERGSEQGRRDPSAWHRWRFARQRAAGGTRAVPCLAPRGGGGREKGEPAAPAEAEDAAARRGWQDETTDKGGKRRGAMAWRCNKASSRSRLSRLAAARLRSSHPTRAGVTGIPFAWRSSDWLPRVASSSAADVRASSTVSTSRITHNPVSAVHSGPFHS